jgi:hypothetical protein
MWTPDLWRSWSLSVESASKGGWIPGEDVGTLKAVYDGDVITYAHVTYDGERVTTPYGTPSGNDASTVLHGGDVLGSAARWVKGPGAVKQRSAHAARAKQATTVINKALVTDRARSLVAHLEGVGISASFFSGSVNDRQSEVRAHLEVGGAVTVTLYNDESLYIRDASGPPRSLEILAAAVDDWENRSHE